MCELSVIVEQLSADLEALGADGAVGRATLGAGPGALGAGPADGEERVLSAFAIASLHQFMWPVTLVSTLSGFTPVNISFARAPQIERIEFNELIWS